MKRNLSSKILRLALVAAATAVLSACASTHYYPVPEASAGVYYGEDSGYYDGYADTSFSFGVYSGPFAFRHYDPFYGSYYGHYCGLYAYCYSNFGVWPYRHYYWSHWSPFQSHYYYYYPVNRYPRHRRPYDDRPRHRPRQREYYSGRHPERGAEDELRAYEMTLEQRKELLRGPKSEWDEGDYKLEPQRPVNRPTRNPAEGVTARPVEKPASGGSGRVIRSRPTPPPRAVIPRPVDISAGDRSRFSRPPARSEPMERRRPVNRPGYQPGKTRDFDRRSSRDVLRPSPNQRSVRGRSVQPPQQTRPVTGARSTGGAARSVPRQSGPPPSSRPSSPPPARKPAAKSHSRAIRSRPKAESPD